MQEHTHPGDHSLIELIGIYATQQRARIARNGTELGVDGAVIHVQIFADDTAELHMYQGGKYQGTAQVDRDSICELIRDRSTSTTHVPKRSPWDRVDGGTIIAPGIVTVHTPGHGGVWLAPYRQDELRAWIAENTPGHEPFTGDWQWWEEDCDAAFCAAAFEPVREHFGISEERAQDYAKRSAGLAVEIAAR